MPLFGSEFPRKLGYLSLVSRRVFRGQLLAQRRTMQLGGGIEFADHREYTPGDDFRYLDWNLYARHDELLLKRFQEEEDLHVYLLLDCSRSMGFGTPPKFDFARQVTAALAYIALADLDRVAVVAFSSDIVADFPLTRGKGRILALLKFLEELPAQGTDTDLARVATGFVHRDQRRGLAVVVSDLYDPHGFERGLDLLRHRKYEPPGLSRRGFRTQQTAGINPAARPRKCYESRQPHRPVLARAGGPRRGLLHPEDPDAARAGFDGAVLAADLRGQAAALALAEAK